LRGMRAGWRAGSGMDGGVFSGVCIVAVQVGVHSFTESQGLCWHEFVLISVIVAMA